MNWQDFLSRAPGRQATVPEREEGSEAEPDPSPTSAKMPGESNRKRASGPTQQKVVEQPLRIRLKEQVMGARREDVEP